MRLLQIAFRLLDNGQSGMKSRDLARREMRGFPGVSRAGEPGCSTPRASASNGTTKNEVSRMVTNLFCLNQTE